MKENRERNFGKIFAGFDDNLNKSEAGTRFYF